jgi:hypothetical protein
MIEVLGGKAFGSLKGLLLQGAGVPGAGAV